MLLQTPLTKIPVRAGVTEATLRKYIAKEYMPVFPAVSIRRKAEGVTVSVIDVDKDGTVTSVTILEAPDDLIRQAVDRAVRKWRFNAPTIGGKPVPIRGKLTFYFVLDKGKGVVRNPKPFR